MISSLNISQNSPVKPFGLGAFCFGRLLLYIFKKYLNYCFKFFIRYKLYFQGMGPFQLDDQIYGHSFLYYSFIILLMSVESIFMSLISFQILISCGFLM